MKWIVLLRICVRTLLKNKLRSLLTSLGMTIGVASIIAMLAIGRGAKSQLEEEIASLGDNVITVASGNISRGGIAAGFGSAPTLTIDDAQAIKGEVGEIAGTSPEIRKSEQVAAGNQNWSTTIIGVSAEYFSIRNWSFTTGGTFDDRDTRGSAKVAIIAQTVAIQLFSDPETAVGHQIRIGIVPFSIIGLLAPKGFSAIGQDQDDVVYIPYTTEINRIAGSRSLRTILVQANSRSEMATAQEEITSLLRQRHHTHDDHDDDFSVRTQEDVEKLANSTTEVLTLLLLAISSVSLVVGGIGIMNIMLVSVTERTREIGIRMALGAKSRDILMQFLLEAVTLSSIGGVFGISVGAFVGWSMSFAAKWPIATSWTADLLAFLYSAAVGIFFGFYPARQAARLDPIEALRYE